MADARAGNPPGRHGGPRKMAADSPAPARARARTSGDVAAGSMPGARPGPMPDFLPPQLATLVATPPAGEEWLHEMKFDGYRILCRIEKGRAILLSRNAKD